MKLKFDNFNLNDLIEYELIKLIKLSFIKLKDILKDIDFSELCITSNAEVSYLENSETKVLTTKAEGSKCPVCWKLSIDPCPRHS